ncbi:hypothetical protein [Vibrio paucivorans]|nr:hypothetical protein [Vibrio paucivorans]
MADLSCVMPKTSGSEDAEDAEDTEGCIENSGLTTVFTSLHTNNG